MSDRPRNPADEIVTGLYRFLEHEMPDARDIAIVNVRPIVGGTSREAWAFDAHWKNQEGAYLRRLMMLRSPVSSVLETDRTAEFRVMHALQGSPVPLPQTYWLDGEGRWLERPCYVMEFVPGASNSNLLLAEGREAEREAIASQFIEVAAGLHQQDWRRRGLAFLGAPTAETAAVQQIEHWERVFEKQRLEAHPALSYAFRWLRGHLPIAERITIVHGDYRFALGANGNFLYDKGRILAMLDWEMVHLGDPMEDIAWAYRPQWSAEPYVAFEDFLRRYEEASGIPVNRESLNFYRMFSEVKIALIVLTGMRSFFAGPAGNLRYATMGRNAGLGQYMTLFLQMAADYERGGWR